MVTVDRERIISAIQVDRLFKDFEIQMEPHEAAHFVEVAPLAGAPSVAKVSGMIGNINKLIPPIDFGPSDPRTGKPHHSIIVGRRRGQRVVIISLFTGFFKPGYDFYAMVDEICAYGQDAGAKVSTQGEDNSELVMMRWSETEAQS